MKYNTKLPCWFYRSRSLVRASCPFRGPRKDHQSNSIPDSTAPEAGRMTKGRREGGKLVLANFALKSLPTVWSVVGFR